MRASFSILLLSAAAIAMSAPAHAQSTCAACHTGQIEYVKNDVTQQLRVDGAPATAHFQLFLTDLTAAARATLNDAGRFDKFAHAALGARYSTSRANALKSDFGDWVKQ